jgi:phospholipid/cholesterol/gamma-HCH transport system ATP-binding protein
MNDQSNLVIVSAYDAIPNIEASDLLFPALNCKLFDSKLTCLVGPHRSQLRNYLLMLAGISRPTNGKVEIFGKSIFELDKLQWQNLRRQIGFFSGVAPLVSGQHGLMNVMLPALYHTNWSFRETSMKARALLMGLNCQFDLSALPTQLDNFQKAQLALARALILDPALLILDLPFNNLGSKEREKMGELLMNNKHQRAICMIGGFQSPQFLSEHADYIIYISEHKIINFNGWTSFFLTEDPDVSALHRAL